ncbi:unnamed protein product [Toxocara canis]|uniref:Uncharacterized protein n=1 Tax=Toxocara canis TaxID=6265 RepID=A0A183U592_TOXCA|nr:unnamed protein product [Toxocara canis]
MRKSLATDDCLGHTVPEHWAEIRDSQRPQRPSVSSILIRQSDSPSPCQFQVDCLVPAEAPSPRGRGTQLQRSTRQFEC